MPTLITRSSYRLCRNKLKLMRAFRKIVSRHKHALRQFQQTTNVEVWGFDEDPKLIDRRESDRIRLQVPAYLTPVRVVGLQVTPFESDSLQIVTRDIAVQGIGMVHDEPLEAESYVAEFDVMEENPIRLLLTVRWTKSLDEWSYRSGTQIVGLLK